MNYVKDGSLKKSLPNIVKDKWMVKLMKLHSIISGLDSIHKQRMVHCDFHHGNILNSKSYTKYTLSISDLGLCKPMESTFKKNDIYGVLPFVAPEVLRGKPYTLASDIYSFSMIMWEFISGILLFNDKEHNFHLALNICKDKRPEIVENTSQCFIDLMKKCWDKDPLKRPDTFEIADTINSWISIIIDKNINEISKKNIAIEFWEAEEKQNNKPMHIIKSHLQEYHTSRLLDFTEKLEQILEEVQINISTTSKVEEEQNNTSTISEVKEKQNNILTTVKISNNKLIIKSHYETIKIDFVSIINQHFVNEGLNPIKNYDTSK